MHDELEANTGIHGVAIFHPRNHNLIVGHVVVGTGSLIHVHSVETPVGSKDIGVNRAFGEVGRRLRPNLVVVALGERNETCVVDIHLGVFLSVERECERQSHLKVIVYVVVAEAVAVANTMLYVDPLKFHVIVVAR